MWKVCCHRLTPTLPLNQNNPSKEEENNRVSYRKTRWSKQQCALEVEAPSQGSLSSILCISEGEDVPAHRLLVCTRCQGLDNLLPVGVIATHCLLAQN